MREYVFLYQPVYLFISPLDKFSVLRILALEQGCYAPLHEAVTVCTAIPWIF